MSRKIKQLIKADGEALFYALCEDSTIWRLVHGKWHEFVDPIPKPELAGGAPLGPPQLGAGTEIYEGLNLIEVRKRIDQVKKLTAIEECKSAALALVNELDAALAYSGR